MMISIMCNKRFRGWFKNAFIFLFWLALWQLLTVMIHNRILLAGPADTIRSLSVQVTDAGFWKAILSSLSRISFGFFLAFFSGMLTGCLAFYRPFLRELLSPAIQLMKSIPVASFVILALIWTGAENLSVLISFLVVYPVIHINTIAGLSHTDLRLLEMARVFRVPLRKQALSIYRPALYPYLESALKTALGMGFKSGIAAEVIGVPQGSIGEGLYMAKIYLSTGELFSWTLTILLVSTAFEKVFLYLLKQTIGYGIPKRRTESGS